MLNKIPSNIFKNLNKILEPCCGKGNFVLGIFDMFYNGLINKYEDSQLLCKDIIEKCLYFGDLESNYCLSMVQNLRDNNISSELYPSPDKIKKQMQYANKKSVGFVAMIGQNEIENNTITLKDMSDGSQKNINFEQLLTILKN